MSDFLSFIFVLFGSGSSGLGCTGQSLIEHIQDRLPILAGAFGQDPYGTLVAGLIPDEQVKAYTHEPIPTFAQALEIVGERGLVIIYDLRLPAQDHPFAANALDICLSELAAAGLGPRAWVLAVEQDIPQVRAALPEATLTAGLDSTRPPAREDWLVSGYLCISTTVPISAQS
ncbi:MAG: hypothetical protein KJ606_02920 [Chloroflexi bacterium]|nr:hypothetical protein [Chloroflexota bacterium]